MAQSLYRQASLVMNPYGAKDTLLPSIKPTDGSGDFTFSRDGSGASPATRVNASGLIEKGRENLLTYSNTFSNADWTKIRSSVTSGQAGYDGSTNAFAFNDSTDNSSHLLFNEVSITSQVTTFSVYAKAGDADFLAVRLGDTANYVYFNLANGTLGTIHSSYIDATITAVGGGWYRCSATKVVGSSSNLAVMLPTQADNSNTYAGLGTAALYIQDAQVELGLISTSYIETTTAPVSAGLLGDMPRLDYSGGATCPSLLLEPSRVNEVFDSENFSSATWQNVGVTITPNAAISPEGLQNAFLLVGTNGGSARIQDYFGALTGVRTFSVFVKSTGTATRLNLQTNDVGGATFTIPVSGLPTLYAQGTNVGTPFVQDYGSGWYRVGFSFNPTGGAVSNYFQIYPDSANNLSSVYAYGAQVEAGSYPTSYIPTYGTAAPRAADVAVKTGVSSLIGQTEGTLYFEGVRPEGGNDYSAFGVSDGTTDNEVWFRFTAADTIEFYLRSGGGQSVGYTYTGANLNQNTKIAFAYKANDVAVYVNGNLVLSDNSVVVPASLTQVSFYIVRGASQFNMIASVKQALLFKTRLTNAELASLTTL